MNYQKPSFISWRFYLLIGLIVMAAMGLGLRLFDLAILKQHFLRDQGNKRSLRLVSSPAFRGMITDRQGYPLAVSTRVFSVWANPQEFSPSSKELHHLARLLAMKAADIHSLTERYEEQDREFVYLKRSISPELAIEIKALNLFGLHLQEEYKRYYPEGEMAAQLIGFTNVDDKGQEGLELAYQNWLQGEPGEKWVTKDRIGRVISELQTVKEQKPGSDLTLSIDRRVQYLAYRELMEGIAANHAHAGSAVVLDVKTGEVLAMVNYPSFNPNQRPAQRSEIYRNRAVTDLFEPGSTVKAFSIASALDSGKYKPDTLVDTFPGWIRVGHNVVRDEENHGPLTVTQILQISSNVGVTKMILSLPPDQLWDVLHRVGFGEVTGVGFPGEPNGVLTKHHPWGDFTLATLAFGYGVSVTTLQLVRAYSVLANQGVKLPVSLLRLDHAPAGERVMEANIAQQMLALLETVVTKEGTGNRARVPGYRVAGKTGTAKIAIAGGYEQHRYISSFIGIAPASNPRFIVAVVIHDPQGKRFLGGAVSGPVFARIMEGTLRMWNIAPDEGVDVGKLPIDVVTKGNYNTYYLNEESQ